MLLYVSVQDQLTKSREIIKKLTEEKKSLAGKLVEAQETLEKEISEHQQVSVTMFTITA